MVPYLTVESTPIVGPPPTETHRQHDIPRQKSRPLIHEAHWWVNPRSGPTDGKSTMGTHTSRPMIDEHVHTACEPRPVPTSSCRVANPHAALSEMNFYLPKLPLRWHNRKLACMTMMHLPKYMFLVYFCFFELGSWAFFTPILPKRQKKKKIKFHNHSSQNAVLFHPC